MSFVESNESKQVSLRVTHEKKAFAPLRFGNDVMDRLAFGNGESRQGPFRSNLNVLLAFFSSDLYQKQITGKGYQMIHIDRRPEEEKK